MKVSISYPPIPSSKGTPLLSQNRQFQYFNEPTYIYPMIPASAATMLSEAGYEVVWDDAIAEQKAYEQWLQDLRKESPDLVVLETKTPVIKSHWRIITDIKNIDQDIKTVLVGDHVTALPKESLRSSMVDYVVTGGDFDFSLLNLARHLEGRDDLERGVWFKDHGEISSGPFSTRHNLNDIPFIDRDLTKWWLYSICNGNYKYTPGTYTMAGRDCWYRSGGGCTFCSWTTLYPSFNIRKPESLLDEIGMLIENYGVKEIFDDTGTFPIGVWLRRFCEGMIERGYNREVSLGCNMRFGALSFEEYSLMKRAGFRFILFGVESANQKTLDILNKGITYESQIDDCKNAFNAGLELHLTIMLGYPWEGKDEAMNTLNLSRYLIKKGYTKTWQVTIVVPYPGTRLFDQAKANGWLKTEDWDRYDMREPILKTPIDEDEILEMAQMLYKVAFDPEFVFRKVFAVRSFQDLKFLVRGAKSILGHVKDFSPKQSK